MKDKLIFDLDVRRVITENSVKFGSISFIYAPYIPLVISPPMVDEKSVDKNKYPHTCPKCNSPAYIGFNKVECSKNC